MDTLMVQNYLRYLQDLDWIQTMHGILILCILWMITLKTYGSKERRLTPQEEEKILEEWIPEPLVPEVSSEHPALSPHIVYGKIAHYVNVDGNKCLDLATHNYFRVVGKEAVDGRALTDLQTYGVGSCGPRAFYGTAVTHLDLEQKIAKVAGQEEAIVFSYGFSTISTVIPAYAKRGDIIFVDDAVNFAIQKGLEASRSTIRYFKHNNAQNLETILHQQDVLDQKDPKEVKKKRKFLILEGIYINTGNICTLPAFLSLAQRYKLRIILDESISFGTLGETGRGVPEHFHIARDAIDITVGSLETALGSIGGFCVGSSYVIEHQRMHAHGYGYSASLPPLLTAAAHAALDYLMNESATIRKLHVACRRLHAGLKTLQSDGLALSGDPLSVVKHLYVPILLQDPQKHGVVLRSIVSQCISNGLAVVTSAYLTDVEHHTSKASLRITANVDLTEEEIHFTVRVLRRCVKNCLTEKPQRSESTQEAAAITSTDNTGKDPNAMRLISYRRARTRLLFPSQGHNSLVNNLREKKMNKYWYPKPWLPSDGMC